MASSFTGGAPAVVGQILSYVQSVADARNTALTTSLAKMAAVASVSAKTDAYTDLSAAIADADALTGVREPIEHQFSLNELKQTYGDAAAKVAADLAASFSTFLSDNFPGMSTYVSSANTWLNNALTVGGTGINSFVEDRLWQRDRNRLLSDAARATDEAMTSWMAKGFALPPGALIHQAAMIERDTQEKISESSRERAIQSFTAELENVRLAVNKSLDIRNAAVSAATQYMQAVAVAPQLGLQITQNVQAAHQRLNDVLLDFYKTDLVGREFTLKLRSTDKQFEREKAGTDLNAVLKSLEQQVAAVSMAAQMEGQQAAAALNALHAQATIAGSDVTQTSIQG